MKGIELVAGKKIKGLSLKGKSRRQRDMEKPGPASNGYLSVSQCARRALAPITRQPQFVSADAGGTYADALNAENANA